MLPALSQSRFGSTRFQANTMEKGAASGGITPSVSMPKRAHAVPKRAVLTGADPFESMESRRRRLAPPSVPPDAQHAEACAMTPAAPYSSTTSSPGHPAGPPARSDAPVMHPTGRGFKYLFPLLSGSRPVHPVEHPPSWMGAPVMHPTRFARRLCLQSIPSEPAAAGRLTFVNRHALLMRTRSHWRPSMRGLLSPPPHA